MLNDPKLRDFRVTILPTHKLCHVSERGGGAGISGGRVYVLPMGCEITSENLAKSSLANDMGYPRSWRGR